MEPTDDEIMQEFAEQVARAKDCALRAEELMRDNSALMLTRDVSAPLVHAAMTMGYMSALLRRLEDAGPVDDERIHRFMNQGTEGP